MATLAQLDALIDANLSAFRAIAGTYEVFEGGVPTIDGFVALINNAAATNFGSNRTDITFNQENAFINLVNAQVQGNPGAAAKFQSITAGAATLQDKLGMIYDTYVPANSQTAEGRAFFTRPEAVTFYQNVAAERGVAGSDGAAIVALASLLNILVNQDIGLGDDINDLRAAIDDGTAALPENGAVFTPIETADGTVYDGDDAAEVVGDTFVLTNAANPLTGGVDDIDGTAGNDTFRAVAVASLDGNDSLFGLDGDDHLIISAGAVTGGSAPIIEGIETITNAGAGFDLANVTGVQRINVGTTQNYTNANLNTVFDVTASAIVTIDYAGSMAGDTTVNFATSLTAANAVEFNLTADGAGVENVNLDISAITGGGETDVRLDGITGLENLTITGAGNAEIGADTGGDTLGALNQANLETVNASAATGNITIALADQDDLTITMGSGNDRVTFAGDEDGAQVTMGGGNDRIIFDEVHNIDDASEDGFAADIITITDFNVTADVLDLGGVTSVGRVTLDNTQQGSIGSGAGDDLFDAVGDAAGFVTGAGDIVTFEFGGNTYIYVSNDGDTNFDATDGLIQLTGVSLNQLSAANFDVTP